LIMAPGSTLLMSTSTGAPSAFARALGRHEARNGAAAKAAPTMPVAVVATVRNWRLPVSTTLSLIRHTPREAFHYTLMRTFAISPSGSAVESPVSM
jgi:hypothetical protein